MNLEGLIIFVYVVLVLVALALLYRLFMAEKGIRKSDTEVVSYGPGESPVISADGMSIMVSVGQKRKPLPQSHDHISLTERSGSKRKYKCGHIGPKWYKLDIYGIESLEMNNKRVDECPACLVARLNRHVIRCALCGLPISPGESVALYHKDSSSVRKDVATIVDENAAVGCLRWDCCPSGGFLAGHWSEEGFVPMDFESCTH